MITDIQGYDPTRDAAGYHFDEKKAKDAELFFSRHLHHTKGKVAGQPFVLEPWQRDIVHVVYGWVDENGNRRYREGLVFIPRKNGKSTFGSGIALKGLVADREVGAEVYAAASARKQARIIYKQAKEMVHADRDLDKRIIVRNYDMEVPKSNSTFTCLAADSNTTYGLNPSTSVIDELLAHKDMEFIDALITGAGARVQPLTIYISTAGQVGPESPLMEIYDYACKVRDGVIEDPQYLPVIYEKPKDLDWHNRKAWEAANPNLGVSVTWDYLEREYKKALNNPRFALKFRTLYLNEFVEAASAWLSMDDWNTGTDNPIHDDGPTYLGIDLSSVNDLTALVMLTRNQDGFYSMSPYFWIPETTLVNRDKQDKAPFQAWADQGFVEPTPGPTVDYDFIYKRVMELADQYNVSQVAMDPANAKSLENRFTKAGLEVVFVRQGYLSMNSPCKELERAVKSKQLRHGGHPVLRWCASNVVVKEDEHENIKPDKKRARDRIDGISALVTAMSRLQLDDDEGDPDETIYDDDGLVMW